MSPDSLRSGAASERLNAERVAAAPGPVGEFDTPVDPRFATFVATNFSEALPGPGWPPSTSWA